MQAVFGIIFHFFGGVASGSFYIPFKNVKGWAWESYWIVGGIFSWLIIPLLSVYFTIPDFANIIQSASKSTIFLTYLMGVLWGIGALTFGLAMRYLGLSLGMSIALGYCSIFGALIPPIYRDLSKSDSGNTISEMMTSASGRMVLAGIFICLAGILICGKAGSLKEKELFGNKNTSIPEFNLLKGVLVATVSGILSACFNFGIEVGKPLALLAIQSGANPLFQNNAIFVVVLWGGFTTNLIWCVILNIKNKTFSNYRNNKTPLVPNYIFCAIAGTTWYLQFFFYGMGESKLGNGASSWILHMAFIILISNFWGIILREWNGVSKKTLTTVVAGILNIIISVLLVGYGNYLQV